MFDRRRRARNWYVALTAMAVLIMASVGVASITSPASTGRIGKPGGPSPNAAVVVSDIQINVQDSDQVELILLVETQNGPAHGARVHMQVTLPNGKSGEMVAVTGHDGTIHEQGQAPGEGTYVLEVTDVELDGHQFDAANSMTSASVVIGEGDGGGDPTPTETEPPTETATETATETETETATETETETATETETEPNPNPDQPPFEYGQWHEPSDHDNGDPPPQWVTNWIQQQVGLGIPGFYSVGLIYGGDEQTNNEWTMKPRAFKGFSTTLDGVDIYYRYHAQSNPMGQDARFHSYEIYARDPSGEISFWQGWQDFGVGDNTLPTVRDGGCEDDSMRPIMGVNKLGCGDYTFESWYSKPGGTGPGSGWVWDTGLNMQATFYHEGDPHDMSTWTRAPDNNDGLVRRVELAWYADRSGAAPRGEWFWATQFGTIVSGPNDSVCGTTRSFGERDYTVKCLPQYIAPTMSSVTFPGNSEQKEFTCPQCTMPN